MPTVEIEYCVPCGFLDRALRVEESLLRTFGEQLDAVTLRTGRDGIFRVSVDGSVVFDVAEDDYDVDEVVRRVRAAV